MQGKDRGFILVITAAVFFIITIGTLFYYNQKTQELKDNTEKIQFAAELAKKKNQQLQDKASNLQKQVTDLSTQLQAKDSEIIKIEKVLTETKATFSAPQKKDRNQEDHDRLKKVLASTFKDEPYDIYQQGPYLVVRIPESEFAFGSSRATPGLIRSLQLISQVVNAYRGHYFLMVEGHTDNVGFKESSSIKTNRELGAKRAMNVVKILESYEVEPGNVLVASWGEHLPLIEYRRPKSEEKNRRIELVFAPRRVVQTIAKSIHNEKLSHKTANEKDDSTQPTESVTTLPVH